VAAVSGMDQLEVGVAHGVPSVTHPNEKGAAVSSTGQLEVGAAHGASSVVCSASAEHGASTGVWVLSRLDRSASAGHGASTGVWV
jgi:hypothetical protein